MQNPRRFAMPRGQYADQPHLANEMASNPVFASIMNEVEDERDRQAVRWQYIYGIADTVSTGQTTSFTLTIEQGTDFKCIGITVSAFNYDAANATIFPAVGNTAWAMRGLSVQIVDANAGRELTSGFIPFELIAAPGYGLNFQNIYPFRYHFYRNNKIRFDVRNRETTAARADHQFAIALLGWKILTPQ